MFGFILGGLGGPEKKRDTAPFIPTNELSFIDKEKKIPSDSHLIQELDLPHLMLPVYKKTGMLLVSFLLLQVNDDRL